MMVSNPQEIPEYEMNPGDFHFRRGEEILKVCPLPFYNVGLLCKVKN